MSETVRDYTENYEFDQRSYDGLAVLHDALFVEEWIYGEKHINQSLHVNEQNSQTLANDQAELLNDLYGTKDLSGQYVVVSGNIYSSTEGDKESYDASDVMHVSGWRYKFGHLRFVKIEDREGPGQLRAKYHAAIKLLSDDNEKQPSYMLLDDAEQVSFPYRLQPIMNMEQLNETLADIMADRRKIRYDETYVSMPNHERKKLLEERAREYTRKLMPLIEQRTPLLIRTNKFTKLSRDKTTPLESVKYDQQLNDDRFLISGHLKRVAFVGNALNPRVSPHLVLEHVNKETIIYSIPLDAHYKIMSLDTPD